MTSDSKLGRLIALCAFASLAACRFRFTDVPDASPELPPNADASADAASTDAEVFPDSPPDACQLGPWTAPVGGQPFAQVNTDRLEWAADLSADGLLLLLETDGPEILVAQRSSPTEPFGTPTRLTISNVTDDDSEPSLNDSELYFLREPVADDECIYVASRTAAPRLWGTPRRLGNLCANATPSGGVYISRDGKHLYYDAVVAGTDQLLMASRPDVSQDFATRGVPVVLLSGMKYCSLTGDELTIYCETKPAGTAPLQLWQATRERLDSPFSNVQPVPGIDTTGFDAGDPSISADGRRLLYAISSIGTDNAADLQLVERRCQ